MAAKALNKEWQSWGELDKVNEPVLVEVNILYHMLKLCCGVVGAHWLQDVTQLCYYNLAIIVGVKLFEHLVKLLPVWDVKHRRKRLQF